MRSRRRVRAGDDQPRIFQSVIDAGNAHDERLEYLAVDLAQRIGVALAQNEPTTAPASASDPSAH
jgi:hypothetical protein